MSNMSDHVGEVVGHRKSVGYQKNVPSCRRFISASSILNSSDVPVLISPPIFSPAHCFTRSNLLVTFIVACLRVLQSYAVAMAVMQSRSERPNGMWFDIRATVFRRLANSAGNEGFGCPNAVENECRGCGG